MKYHILALLWAVCLFAGCKKHGVSSQAVVDEARIKAYLTANQIIAQQDSSGLFYDIINEGDSIHRPMLTSSITVNYMGTLLDGTIFASTTNSNDSTTTPITLLLSQAVPGWQIGLQKITQGGSILLIIPSALGYGNKPAGPIPANAVLIYRIELLNVQ
ncbi:MAG TPA: FKBP-type peptidyl-prolyl cis-trans isomerase [Chitinophagaceae bacterium]|nr:FKBP-type peptidyl-prolyl cis-trans isomerase [Chitinophagaceae bacterium]